MAQSFCYRSSARSSRLLNRLQRAFALFPPFREFWINASIKISEPTAGRHYTIEEYGHHFLGDEQGMFVASFGHQHIPRSELVGNALAGGCPSPLNDNPKLIGIMKVKLHSFTQRKRVDPIF